MSKEIEGYSFAIASNFLTLLPREEKKADNKILICACKKYR